MPEEVCAGYWTGQHDRLLCSSHKAKLAEYPAGLWNSCGFEETMHWDEMAGEIHAKRLNRSGTRRASSTVLTAPRVPTVMLTSRSIALDKRALHQLALPARMSNRLSTGEWKKHILEAVCAKHKPGSHFRFSQNFSEKILRTDAVSITSCYATKTFFSSLALKSHFENHGDGCWKV